MRLRYWIPLVLVIDVILNVAIGLIWKSRQLASP